MYQLPHRYTVAASGSADQHIVLESEGLPTLQSAPPVEFGGPGDRWSPETLLVAAVADCFLLTFRAIALASQLPWRTLTCEVVGTLDRVERVMQFTRFDLRARLDVPAGSDRERAQRALQRAEESCLITNSLKAGTHLQSSVHVDSHVPGVGEPELLLR